MKEDAKTEQFLEVDEEQLQAVTGAVKPPSDVEWRVSPIGANRTMAEILFDKAFQAHQRGSIGLSQTIEDNALKHAETANKLEGEKVAGKKPMIVEPKRKPIGGSRGGTLKIYG